MFTKQLELIFQVIQQSRKGCFILFLIAFSSYGLAQSLSVADFNAQLAEEAHQVYTQFREQWILFLKEKSTLPKLVTPASARKATEEYLASTGGLKQKLAQASSQNQFGFTFKRPVDDPIRSASYHRAYNSIFIDIENVSPQAWLVRFVHEIAHSLDSEMYASLKVYNDEEFLKNLEVYGEKKVALKSLDAVTRKKLDQWLIAGLNRGLLGEYRAWLVTLLIYNEGLQDGTFSEMKWLEEIKKSQPVGVSLSVHLFRYLSPSWIDPTEGWFAYEYIQQALLELRQKLLDDPTQIKMGQLGFFLKKSISH